MFNFFKKKKSDIAGPTNFLPIPCIRPEIQVVVSDLQKNPLLWKFSSYPSHMGAGLNYLVKRVIEGHEIVLHFYGGSPKRIYQGSFNKPEYSLNFRESEVLGETLKNAYHINIEPVLAQQKKDNELREQKKQEHFIKIIELLKGSL